MKKSDLAKQIKTFMYDYDLTDKEAGLRVISACYLKSVLYRVYNNNSKTEPYGIIAGDFNKLNDLNKLYGFEEGNNCLNKALKIISSELPHNALICRNGGDEFLFILPKQPNKVRLEGIIARINQSLSINSNQIHNLSISMCAGSSVDCKTLEELYVETDTKVDELKKDRNIREGKFYTSYQTLYDSLRLSDDFQFTNDQMKVIIDLMVNTTNEMLTNYKKIGKFEDEPYPSYLQMININRDLELDLNSSDYNKLKEFNDIFLNTDEPTEDDLVNITPRELMCVARELVTVKGPKAYSKDYFLHYLKDNLLYGEYKLSLLTLSGLKLANLLYGHDVVDRYMEHHVYNNVHENIDINIPLCKSLFSDTGDAYKIYLGGGDILYIENPDSHYRPNPEFYEINDMQITDSNNPMSLLTTILQYSKISSTRPIDIEGILSGNDNWVSTAKSKFRYKKDAFKDDIFKSKHIDVIARKILKPDLEVYVKMHPNDFMKSDNVREFLENECKVMAIHKPIQTREKPEESERFQDSDFHIDYAYHSSYDDYISSKKDIHR